MDPSSIMQRVFPDDVPEEMAENFAAEYDDLVAVEDALSKPTRGQVMANRVSYGLSYCKRALRAVEVHRDREPLTLVAVGCSGSKHEDDGTMPTKDRYRGGYWTNKREYAETIGDDWRVISAEHAVLAPNDPIEYYECVPSHHRGIPVDHDGRLPSGEPVRTKLDLWAFEVHNKLAEWLDDVANGADPRDVELEVLLGKKYSEPLRDRDVFDGLRVRGDFEVSFPFREVDGLGGIGHQRSWMVSQVELATAVATDGGTPEGGI